MPQCAQANFSEKVSVGAVDDLDLDEALGELCRRLDGVGEAAAQPLLHDEAVDDDLDGVLVLLVELDLLGELADLGRRP